jgi:DNA processing protein
LAGCPRALREAKGAPESLWVAGDFAPSTPAVAIVGSRKPSPYGLRMARALAAQAARRGWVVVSGLAYGIDTAAHEACLAAGGVTYAVLGSGLHRVYPRVNEGLAARIVEGGGAVLSELALDAAPLPSHFPARNRIIAGLAWATVVVEGRETSGSLVTGKLSIDMGREVFAVLGPAESSLSAAGFILMTEGARPLRTMADAWCHLTQYAALDLPSTNTLDEPVVDEKIEASSLIERKVLEYLGSESLSLSELAQMAALDIVRLSTILLDMELSGFIQSLPGQRYAKKRN